MQAQFKHPLPSLQLLVVCDRRALPRSPASSNRRPPPAPRRPSQPALLPLTHRPLEPRSACLVSLATLPASGNSTSSGPSAPSAASGTPRAKESTYGNACEPVSPPFTRRFSRELANSPPRSTLQTLPLPVPSHRTRATGDTLPAGDNPAHPLGDDDGPRTQAAPPSSSVIYRLRGDVTHAPLCRFHPPTPPRKDALYTLRRPHLSHTPYLPCQRSIWDAKLRSRAGYYLGCLAWAHNASSPKRETVVVHGVPRAHRDAS